MTGTTDTVGEGSINRRSRPVISQTIDNGAKAVGHCRAVDNGKNRQTEIHREFGGRWRSVVKPHHTFNENQIGLARGFGQPPSGIFPATHPQVDVLTRRTAGYRMNLRVEKIRAAFEDAHLSAKPRVQPGQRGNDSRLSLPGRRRSNKQSRAAKHWLGHVLTTPAPAWL